MINRPVLITGAARSGTSLTAGIVHLCGAWGGVMFGANNNNKKGMFENSEIRQDLTKPYLRALKVDPLGQNPLPDLSNPELVERLITDGRTWWRSKVSGAIQRQGYIEGPWFYKGAKMCLIWPLWDAAFPQAKWIIVRRSTDDIAASCMRTGFMRAYRTMEGWRAWVKIHENRFTEMKLAGLDIKEIWPQQIIRGELSGIKGILNWIGLPFNEDKILDFVSPSLWKEGRHYGK